MTNSSETDIRIIQALSDIVKQNRYAAMQSMRIIYNYDPSTNIELWLRLFDAKADRLGLDELMKIDQLPSYLPVNMAQWILSNSLLDTWTKIKKALIDTFGIPVAQQKQTCRSILMDNKTMMLTNKLDNKVSRVNSVASTSDLCRTVVLTFSFEQDVLFQSKFI